MRKLGVIIVLAAGIFCSCSHSRFLDRKYTSGRYVENSGSIKHNTIFVDDSKQYASVSDKIKDEMINREVKISNKKDSIFIKIKKGRDQKIVKKNDQSFHVTTIANESGVIISQKRVEIRNVPPTMEGNKDLEDINRLAMIALACSIVPVLGFVMALRFKKRFNVYRKNHPKENLKKISVKGTTALIISTITSFGPVIFFTVLFMIFLLAIALTA